MVLDPAKEQELAFLSMQKAQLTEDMKAAYAKINAQRETINRMRRDLIVANDLLRAAGVARTFSTEFE